MDKRGQDRKNTSPKTALVFYDQKKKAGIFHYFIILTRKEEKILPISQISLSRQGG